MPSTSSDLVRYARISAVAGAVLLCLGLAAVLLWQLSDVVLILFASVLFSLLLDSLATMVGRWLRLPRALALGLVVLAVVSAILGTAWIVGPRLGNQLYDLAARLPDAVDQITEQLRQQAWGRAIVDDLPSVGELVQLGSLGRISGVFSTTFGALSHVVVIAVVGTYLAISPGQYMGAGLRLLPAAQRHHGRELLTCLGHALRWWLLGRVASMTVVGLLTALGLWLIEMPLVLALSLIAGLLSFVPYLGPVAAAVPALLIGLMGSPYQAVYVLAVYTVVQLMESYVITPLIQERAVALPPAALITAQLIMAVLFGMFGLLLATPLAVAAIVTVQVLYVRKALGEDIPVLGQHGGEARDRPAR